MSVAYIKLNAKFILIKFFKYCDEYLQLNSVQYWIYYRNFPIDFTVV